MQSRAGSFKPFFLTLFLTLSRHIDPHKKNRTICSDANRNRVSIFAGNKSIHVACRCCSRHLHRRKQTRKPQEYFRANGMFMRPPRKVCSSPFDFWILRLCAGHRARRLWIVIYLRWEYFKFPFDFMHYRRPCKYNGGKTIRVSGAFISPVGDFLFSVTPIKLLSKQN